MTKVGVVVGSLRKGSFSKMVAHALEEVAPEGMSFNHLEWGDLPLFNQDLEQTPPQQWVDFREQIKAVDALLFVTPEYNRSIPGGLKNALDVGSRPYGQNSWGGKPGMVVSSSIGKQGGFGAYHHLRQVLSFLDVPLPGQPEVYLSDVSGLFEEGKLNNDGTRDFLKRAMKSYGEWIARFKK